MAIRVFERLGRWVDARRRQRSIRDAANSRASGPSRDSAAARATAVRPRGRDAGRPEDPDHSRLLRALLHLVPVRGQRAGALRGAGRKPRPTSWWRRRPSTLADAASGDSPTRGRAAVVSIDAAGDDLHRRSDRRCAKAFLKHPGGFVGGACGTSARRSDEAGLEKLGRRIAAPDPGGWHAARPNGGPSRPNGAGPARPTDDKRARFPDRAWPTDDRGASRPSIVYVFLTGRTSPRARLRHQGGAMPALQPRLLDEAAAALGCSPSAGPPAPSSAPSRCLRSRTTSSAGQRGTRRRRGALDFDDLIDKTRRLLARGDAAWVLYKLDRGIDHVLVDEAQDTNPEQWEILRLITADFTAGSARAAAGADALSRSAIPSSRSTLPGRGAAGIRDQPAALVAQGRAGGAEIRGCAPHGLVPLGQGGAVGASTPPSRCRSTFKGLSFEDSAVGTVHESARPEAPGLVELWPVEKPAAEEEPEAWVLPVDEPETSSPPVVVGAPDRPGHQVLDRQGRRDGPGPEGRRHPGSGAQARRGLRGGDPRPEDGRGCRSRAPTGSNIGEHIAVLDLVAAGRAALLPDDDLTLATALKSPLVGFTDDDLIRIAAYRGEGKSSSPLSGGMPATGTRRRAGAARSSYLAQPRRRQGSVRLLRHPARAA